MYNRYFRNDHGEYERVSVPPRDHPHSPASEPHREPFVPPEAPPPPHEPPFGHDVHCNSHEQPLDGFPHGGPHDSPRFLGRVLDKLKLQDVDTKRAFLVLQQVGYAIFSQRDNLCSDECS